MKPTRVVLATLAVIVLSVIYFSPVSAQQYKRHALIEEGTGVWCGYCPYGAYTIDSMISSMGDNLVAISWHGPPGSPYYEPLGMKAGDTIGSYVGATGFPWASPGRDVAMSGAYEQGGQLDWPNPWFTLARAQAEQAPPVDFRVVNTTYSSGAVDFDIEITPIDITHMPTEDTTTYVTVAVITEDGIVESQHIYDDPNETDISDFRHHNVARAVGGKVTGDKFVVKGATQWPIIRHYHISTNRSGWVQDSLRIKAFAALQSKKGNGEAYLDAGQSGYITTLPSSAASAVWTVLPQANKSFSGDSTQLPIVWSKGGNVSSVKLEYSIDKGATWNTIIASTSASPYEWQLTSDVYGQSIQIRVSDASNASTTFTGPTFSIAAKPTAAITVVAPQANDQLRVGSKENILFAVSGPVNETGLQLSYSTDSMATWNPIATVSNATSYNWTVPNIPTTTAAIQIKDANGVIGLSPIFSIIDTSAGKVTSVTISGAPNLPINYPETIYWKGTGNLGETVDLSYWDPTAAAFNSIKQGLPSTDTSYLWLAFPNTAGSGYYIKVTYASGATGVSAPFNIGESNGVTPNALVDGLTLSPNPISGISMLRFGLADGANVTLIVRDLLGREVMRIPEGMLASGSHEIAIDGAKFAAGAYEYQLLIGSTSFLGKLTVLR